MKVIVHINGKNLEVETPEKSEENTHEEKIWSFIQDHSPHGIIRHFSHKFSSPVSYVKEGAGWPVTDKNRVQENWEIVECSKCGNCVDITNGDFILNGVNITKGENMVDLLWALLGEYIPADKFSKLQVIKALRKISQSHPHLICHFGYELNLIQKESEIFTLVEAKDFSEKILGL